LRRRSDQPDGGTPSGRAKSLRRNMFRLASHHFNGLVRFREAQLANSVAYLAALALTGIKTEYCAAARLTSCMSNFVFKCPRTGMNVQHRLADETVPGDQRCTYETVLCQACGRLHFINRSSHRLLGEKEQ
jgi:hypothetical protein